jgi:transposase
MKRGKAKIEKIDHLGIVAGVIRELRIIETIDKLIGTDDKKIIATGEAVAGMILNGLGFTSRALSLTPQFFETKAVERLIREKMEFL